MPGVKGERRHGALDRQRDQQHVEDAFVRNSRDTRSIPDQPPPLGDHRRQRRELAVEQHQLGHSSAGRGAGAHRDADIAVLEREHVVDAIAGHGDDAPGDVAGR